MADIDLERFEKLILKMRTEVLKNFDKDNRGESLKEASGNHSYSFHMADQGSDCNEYEKSFLLSSMEGNILEELDASLIRIKEDRFGACVLCGAKINPKRLEAIPYAKLCLECKAKEEQQKY